MGLCKSLGYFVFFLFFFILVLTFWGKSLVFTPLSPQDAKVEFCLDKRLETHLRKCLKKIWLGLGKPEGYFHN